MTMKKIIAMTLCLLMLCSVITVSAVDKVSVVLDGNELTFDVDPVIENGRTLVPFRAIFEALGCSVFYTAANGAQYVEAVKGDTVISLTIGKNEMLVNGEAKTLDTAPKIVSGRTLVPLRAVSESLGCQVSWIGESRTAVIESKLGEYPVTTGVITNTVKAADGAVLMDISCTYPIVCEGSDDPFIKSINDEYLNRAQLFADESAAEFTEAAQMMYDEAADFVPFRFSFSYEVTTNRKNWLSITTYTYSNTAGAHPSTSRDSDTYQMIMNKKLSVEDLLGYELEYVEQTIFDMFVTYFEQNEYPIDAEIAENIGNEAKNVKWYITDNSAVFYFDHYTIAPYAFGAPTIEIPYDGKFIALDLTEAAMEALSFELDSNPTTGYTWAVSGEGLDRITVEEEFVSGGDADTLGAGGKSVFTVKGASEGNVTLTLSYMRAFEGEDSIEKTVTYKLYVNSDNTVTVINRIEG